MVLCGSRLLSSRTCGLLAPPFGDAPLNNAFHPVLEQGIAAPGSFAQATHG
jgi:hypothetical protein